MESNSQKKTRNIVLVASTGSGKSHTGNSILGMDYFYVGDDLVSCTSQVSHATNQKLNIKVIDTPGFGDHRMAESNIDQILKDLALRIVSFDDATTNQIDAFLLVVKLDPRPASLKQDLEHMMSLFGSRCLKTTILLPIVHYSKKPWTDEELYKQMSGWEEINSIVGNAKGENFNGNWYVRWDNLNPRNGQLNELMEKCKKIPPYTHEMFIAAQKEIQQRIDKRIKERVEKETLKLKEKYRDEEQKMNLEIEKMKIKLEEERVRRKQSARQAEEDAKELAIRIQNMQEQSDRVLQEELKKINEEKLRQEKILQEQLQKDTERYKEDLARQEREYKQKMEELQRKLKEAERNRPVVHRRRGGCFDSSTLVVRKRGDLEEKVEISQIKVGDFVMAFTDKGKMIWDEVVLVDDGAANSERHIISIQLQGNPHPLQLTHHHYVYKSTGMVCAREIRTGDTMFTLDSNNKLKSCLVKSVKESFSKIPVRNIITAETHNLIAGDVLCSVHCQGDWGRFYFAIGTFLWKYVSKQAPSYMFRIHKWAKSFSLF